MDELDFSFDNDMMMELIKGLQYRNNFQPKQNKSTNGSNNSTGKFRKKEDAFFYSKIEFGNFDDREHTTFRRVVSSSMSSLYHHLGFQSIPNNKFNLFWKENGDFTVYFQDSPYKFWIEINRNNIKKVLTFDDSSMAIVLNHAPAVHRQKGDDTTTKSRMAAPTDKFTQLNSFWLHNFHVAKTLLFTKSNILHPTTPQENYSNLFKDKMKKVSAQNIMYSAQHCSGNKLIMTPIDGMNIDGELCVNLGVKFETFYNLLCLNSKVPGLLASRERLLEIKQLIEELKDEQSIKQALEKCLHIEAFHPAEFVSLLKKHAHKRQHSDSFGEGDENMFQIRKVFITPTGIQYLCKSLEPGNRVLRKYKEYQDRFLRVTFCDEGLNRVSAEKVTNMHPRLEGFLNDGFKIDDRLYNMLAYSNSQLRSHSSWFFNEGRDLKIRKIIEDLGDFSDIKVMAKYAARIGQCFSATSKGIEADFIEVEDILHKELDYRDYQIKKYVLNDGCGRMTVNFAKKVSEEMKIRINGKAYIPSALQFRMGGYKGVVVQDNDIQSLFGGKELVLTKSQNKFKDESNVEFELVGFSKRPKSSTLNRQIIVLLSSNGLPDAALMKALNKELEIWKSRTTNKNSLRRLLRRVWDNVVGKNIKKVIKSTDLDLKAQVLSSQIPKMVNVGYFYNLDPLLCNLCDRIMISQLSSLKTNIPVDKCSLLMGVVDFTGVLEDDEVFVQLSAFEKYEQDLYDPGSYAEGGIVTGNVFVTRNPCLHPGDIRKLKAVSGDKTNPLKHLRDVIVFSQKSKRAQASKMAGGDYDGDLFLVCWDPDLQNFTEYEPMEHTQLKPIEKPEGFDYKATRDFLKEYVVNDNLGVVAFMHLEHYDQSPLGARDSTCLEIADYHSHQVDYAKTGVRKALPKEWVTKERPHYLPKIFLKEVRQSEKIPGKIHDKVDQFIKSHKKLEKHNDINPHFKTLDLLFVKYKPFQMLFKDHDQFKEVKSTDSIISKDILDLYNSVKQLYKDFKYELGCLTSTYQVSESELMVGLMDFKKLESKCGKSAFKLREEVRTHIDKFISHHSQECKKILKQENGFSKQEIASLLYIVVRNDNISKKKFKYMFGLTFYWLVMDKLLK